LSLDEIAAFNNIQNTNSISDFDAKYDKLFFVIKAKMLGKISDVNLKKKLTELNTRIINSLNGPKKIDFEEKWNKLYEMADKGVHDFEIGTAGIKK